KELNNFQYIHGDYERKAFIEGNNVVNPYVRYYKRFKKTYHVLPQLESVLSGKKFPEETTLVQILFLAELKTHLLIAAHDLKKCHPPLTIQMSQGGETYLGSNNRNIILKPKDICLRDTDDYILSIVYGQDERTRITKETTDVLFLIDGVPGLERKYVEDGLATLLSYIRAFDPDIKPKEMKVISSSYLEEGKTE
ncbi:MAG: phenylalanine--tRNA ligase beta subunit-related protein, partial [Thermotaleaceae bacterium]